MAKIRKAAGGVPASWKKRPQKKSSIDSIIIGITVAAFGVTLLVVAVVLIFLKLESPFGSKKRLTADLMTTSEETGGFRWRGSSELSEALAKKDWVAAVRILEAEYRKHGTSADIRHDLGQAHLNAALEILGRDAKASALLKKASLHLQRAASLLVTDKRLSLRVAQAEASLGVREYETGLKSAGTARVERALRKAGTDPFVNYLRGYIYYLEGRYRKAEPYLKRAVFAKEADIRRAAQGMLSEIKTDLAEEKTFNVEETSRFVLKYQGPVRPDLASKVLSALERSEASVATIVGRAPQRKVVVILYTGASYKSAREIPDWSSASFDGRIRLSEGDINSSSFERTVRHEYTHAATFDYLGRSPPAWLDEGAAQCVAEGVSPPLERLRSEIGARWYSLSRLNGSFSRYSRADADRAYAISYAAVGYLIRRYGSGIVQSLLEEMKHSRSLDAALRIRTGLSLNDLDRETQRWVGFSGQ